jgi:hypothetical protein
VTSVSSSESVVSVVLYVVCYIQLLHVCYLQVLRVECDKQIQVFHVVCC